MKRAWRFVIEGETGGVTWGIDRALAFDVLVATSGGRAFAEGVGMVTVRPEQTNRSSFSVHRVGWAIASGARTSDRVKRKLGRLATLLSLEVRMSRMADESRRKCSARGMEWQKRSSSER